jgi:hypothetical protein
VHIAGSILRRRRHGGLGYSDHGACDIPSQQPTSPRIVAVSRYCTFIARGQLHISPQQSSSSEKHRLLPLYQNESASVDPCSKEGCVLARNYLCQWLASITAPLR